MTKVSVFLSITVQLLLVILFNNKVNLKSDKIESFPVSFESKVYQWMIRNTAKWNFELEMQPKAYFVSCGTKNLWKNCK